MEKLPKIVVIVGPTGSGKSDLALQLARKFDGEVVAADSRTIYKEMNIGTAKPLRDPEESLRLHDSIHDLFGPKPYFVQGVPHWGFDLILPDESYDVSRYAIYARERIEDILRRGKLPIVVGGSGLYVQAIVDNPTFSEVKPDLALRAQLQTLSLDVLQKRLHEIDPEAYDLIDIQNPRRLVRAIEVVELTGKSWTSQQQQQHDPYLEALQIGLEVDRDMLYERLDARVDKMVASGLIDEVRTLYAAYGAEAPGMSGIGYRQIVAFFKGEIKLREAVLLLKRDTKHYAKRQLTWFKRDARIRWIQNAEEAELLIEAFL